MRILAAAEGRTQSEIAEEALDAYLRDRQESVDWAKAGESALRFWDNPDDAAYDDL